MQESRHPHPHVDPRQPRGGTRPGTNPPVFAWQPPPDAGPSDLRVARDAELKDVAFEQKGLADPLCLPEKAFEPGRYFWTWSAGACRGDIFSFEIAGDAVVLEVPSADEWLKRFPDGHPRLYLRPEEVDSLRASCGGERREAWAELEAVAQDLLDAPHEMAEPPFLPDKNENYEAFFREWSRVLWESRRFVKEAENLALAFLASGEERYARAACRRMASVSEWDPYGSTHLPHNDEAHMSLLWDGVKAVDWVWDAFTDEERERVIRQYRERGRITFEHMHGRGSYGVTRFDSHAGREIVFLALLAIVFHEHIPEAREWLAWLRPVLCGIWPIWGGDDGAWAEGPAYATAYVGIMAMFATALKRGAGVDLYRRPFWRGHAEWRRWCWPSYAEWLGFGDHNERWAGSWRGNADLVETIDEETGANAFGTYVAALRREADASPERPETGAQGKSVNSLRFLARSADAAAEDSPAPAMKVFTAAGWAAIRRDLDDPARDAALIFRSSPYGAISHSHANNNDFILHAGGKVLLMPSGYYDGYGSDHHIHWVWHSKSHNCLTLSDAGQLMRSPESRGAVVRPFEDERLAYLCGDADASYADRAVRCRRHVLFLKAHACFVLVDEFEARPDVASAVEWNAHSWAPFAVDEDARRFRIERGGCALDGMFLYHHNAFFTLSEGWNPPMLQVKSCDRWYPQHHLRFTVSGLSKRVRLGVVLAPACGDDWALPEIATRREGEAEAARIGDDLVLVNQGDEMTCDGIRSDAPVAMRIGAKEYEITEQGLRPLS